MQGRFAEPGQGQECAARDRDRQEELGPQADAVGCEPRQDTRRLSGPPFASDLERRERAVAVEIPVGGGDEGRGLRRGIDPAVELESEGVRLLEAELERAPGEVLPGFGRIAGGPRRQACFPKAGLSSVEASRASRMNRDVRLWLF